MVVVSFLEGTLSESIVDLGRSSWCCDGRFVNDARCLTLVIQGAVGRHSTVTWAGGCWGIDVGTQDLGVMGADNRTHRGHTAITAFDIIHVK